MTSESIFTTRLRAAPKLKTGKMSIDSVTIHIGFTANHQIVFLVEAPKP
jgi:hypothetical protein